VGSAYQRGVGPRGRGNSIVSRRQCKRSGRRRKTRRRRGRRHGG